MKLNIGSLKTFFLIIPLVTGINLSAAGGKEIGNGGGGILEDGKPYLLDLVETGVEKNPFFKENVSVDPVIEKRVVKALSSLPDAPFELISKKFSELAQVDRILAASLLRVMEMYLWRPIDFTLVRIHDEKTVVSFPPEQQVQLAARIEHSIVINAKAWESMDSANKTALIFHEAIYALLSPEEVMSASGQRYLEQSSPRAREITGYLFSPDSQVRGRAGLKQIVEGSLPMEQSDEARCAWISDVLHCDPEYDAALYYSLFMNPRQYNSVSEAIESECSFSFFQTLDSFVFAVRALNVEAGLRFESYESPDQLRTYVSHSSTGVLTRIFLRQIPYGRSPFRGNNACKMAAELTDRLARDLLTEFGRRAE